MESDSPRQQDAIGELDREPTIPAARIGVEVKDMGAAIALDSGRDVQPWLAQRR